MTELHFSQEKNHISRDERDAAIKLFYNGDEIAYQRALKSMSAPNPDAPMDPTLRLNLLPPPDPRQQVKDTAPIEVATATAEPANEVNTQPAAEAQATPATPEVENMPSDREKYQNRINEAIMEAVRAQGAHEPELDGKPLIEAIESDPELVQRPRLQLRLLNYAREAIARVIPDGNGRHRA